MCYTTYVFLKENDTLTKPDLPIRGLFFSKEYPACKKQIQKLLIPIQKEQIVYKSKYTGEDIFIFFLSKIKRKTRV